MPQHRRPARPVPSRQQRSSSYARPDNHLLSPTEVLAERLLLAADMLHLVLEDGQDLSREARRTLTTMAERLASIRRQAPER